MWNFWWRVQRWLSRECVECGMPLVSDLPLWRRPWPEKCCECDDGLQV
jgi:hypothetical protein